MGDFMIFIRDKGFYLLKRLELAIIAHPIVEFFDSCVVLLHLLINLLFFEGI